MSPVRQNAGIQQPELANESVIKTWLDALASGSCDEAAFLWLVQEKFKSDPDGNWEVLSQLDQYYRRGRIKGEVFHAVKNALGESTLRGREVPVARDFAVPQVTARTERSDAQLHGEETQSLDAAAEPKLGSVLRRRYRIENILGQGSMGTVFQALDEYRLEKPPGSQRLAIKVLHQAVTKRADLLTELRREFQQMQLLSHPRILRVFEFDRDGPIVFFTMELLNGSVLSRVLHVRKLIPLVRTQALAIIRDIGAAIAYAHSRGVVHGAINPQNIFITTPGELRVLGFGGSHGAYPGAATPDHETTLPSATASYASCQVLEGERANERDDVFSLACIAYLLLRGEHPFAKKSAIDARQARLRPRRPPNLTNLQWRALRAGLRWEREDRPADVQQWLERLQLRGAARHVAPLADLLAAPQGKESKSVVATAAVVTAAMLLAAAYWVISHPNSMPRIDASLPTRNSAVSAPASNDPSPLPASHSAPAAAPSVAARSTAAQPTATPARASLQTPAPTPTSTQAATQPGQLAALAATPPAARSASKIEMAADAVDVPAGEPLAIVSVRRKGNLRGETSFSWWTESGTAKPGIDFSAVVPQLATIGDGKSSVSLSIPLSNSPRTQQKSFYVVIDQSEGGALVGARTLSMITLLPSG